MSAPVPYFDVVRQMKNAFDYRLRLVTYARPRGIKAAGRTRLQARSENHGQDA
jgi:hypothetical protein